MLRRTGLQANQTISLSGGEPRLRYLLSGNFTRQQGIELGSDFNRYAVRLNLDGDVSPRFRWSTSLSLTRVARNAAGVENAAVGNSANGIQAALQFAPYASPRDAAGNWIKTSPSTEPVPNPVARAMEETDLNTTSRMLGSINGEFDLTPPLRVKSMFGGSCQCNGIHFFAPRTILDGGAGGCFFFSSRRRHTRCSRDWSSDVCSSDLIMGVALSTRTTRSATIRAKTTGSCFLRRRRQEGTCQQCSVDND